MNLKLLTLTGNSTIAITIIAVIGSILLIGLILLAILYPIFRKKYMYRNFRYVYHKKIYSIAEKNDYLLLNNVHLRNKEVSIATIDHILFARKYIYVIKDRFYKGAISGNKSDSVWLFFNKQSGRTEIHNPMSINKTRIEKLISLTGISKDLFISIILVNDDCVIQNPKDLNSKRSYIVSVNQLPKLIKNLEKNKDIKDINQETLEVAVQEIYRLYGKGSEGND